MNSELKVTQSSLILVVTIHYRQSPSKQVQVWRLASDDLGELGQSSHRGVERSFRLKQHLRFGTFRLSHHDLHKPYTFGLSLVLLADIDVLDVVEPGILGCIKYHDGVYGDVSRCTSYAHRA